MQNRVYFPHVLHESTFGMSYGTTMPRRPSDGCTSDFLTGFIFRNSISLTYAFRPIGSISISNQQRTTEPISHSPVVPKLQPRRRLIIFGLTIRIAAVWSCSPADATRDVILHDFAVTAARPAEWAWCNVFCFCFCFFCHRFPPGQRTNIPILNQSIADIPHPTRDVARRESPAELRPRPKSLRLRWQPSWRMYRRLCDRSLCH